MRNTSRHVLMVTTGQGRANHERGGRKTSRKSFVYVLLAAIVVVLLLPTPVLASPPTVTTNDASNVTINSARLNGELTSLGTSSSVTVSFLWGVGAVVPAETPGMTMSQTGIFYFDLPGLMPNTKYYYRVKAVGDGNSWGEEKSFITAGSSGAIPRWAFALIGLAAAGVMAGVTYFITTRLAHK
jgi:hypothetical protein